MPIPLILFCLCLLFAPPALAEAPDLSALKRTGTGKVEKIIDGLTILLKDEKIIRLSGIDLPGAPGDPENPYALAAKAALENALPEGTDILIYQTRKAKIGRQNRMGHDLAHLVTKNGERWINGLLVEKGLARAFPTDNNPEMADALFTLEEQAIASKTALWAAQSAPVFTPEQAEKIIGHVAVIEGRVHKAAAVRNKLYLNFGADWKSDFTVMISPTIRKKLAHTGIDPVSLSGELIRVRGYVRSYNGPFLELAHPAHLQIINPAPLQENTEIPTIDPNP